jgi:hypothetical protein
MEEDETIAFLYSLVNKTCNELSDTTKCGEILEYLNDWRLINKYSAARS